MSSLLNIPYIIKLNNLKINSKALCRKENFLNLERVYRCKNSHKDKKSWVYSDKDSMRD